MSTLVPSQVPISGDSRSVMISDSGLELFEPENLYAAECHTGVIIKMYVMQNKRSVFCEITNACCRFTST